MNNCYAHLMLHQEKEAVFKILPIQSKTAGAKKQCILCVFCSELGLHLLLHLPFFKVWGLQNDYTFCISVNKFQK